MATATNTMGLTVLNLAPVQSSHIITRCFAARSVDSTLPSKDICTRLSNSLCENVKSDIGSIIKIGLGAAACYGAYKLAKNLWYNQRKHSKGKIDELGQAVLKCIEDVANGDDGAIEEETTETIMVGEVDIGVVREIPAEVRLKRRHRKAPFLAKVTNMAKNHFGGCPDPTKSNVMAVSKFVYDTCKEHNCLPHQTRHIISIVVPLVLSPDEYDITSRALLNSDILCENRAKRESASSISGWLVNLIAHPLSATAWRRAMDNLCGLPDWKAFRLVN